MSDGLVAFLRARLDEDEAAAKAAGGDSWRATESGIYHEDAARSPGPFAVGPYEYLEDSERAHIARHDPAWVLREVEAGRSLLVELAAAKVAYTQASSICIDMRDRVSVAKYDATVAATYAAWRGLQRMALAKAAVYRDHPDYRQEWAP